MRYISLILIFAFAVGCTKLEPQLYSDLTTANAYSTESDISAALTGVYADIAPFAGDGWMYYNGYLVMTTDYNTDMGYSTAAGDPTRHSNFTYDANSRYIRYNWQYMYEVISNANMLLSKIDAVSMDASKKAQIIGQARFLRALAYRDLTDGWGPVPLITTIIAPDATRNMELSPVSEVDKVIIEDLKYGIANLPETWSSADGLSRATKGAATALLGQVYLRAHDYPNAKIYIDMVLAQQQAGVYKLNPDFKNVWSESNKFDKGMIFCILHEPGFNGGEITNHYAPLDSKEVPDRWGYYAVSLEFWRKYNDLDPRKQFFYYNYESSSIDGRIYEMPTPGQTVPSNPDNLLMRNVCTKKYSYEMTDNSYYDGRTIPVLRIEDIILNKAEIENQLSGPSAALPFLNEIRERAGAPAYGTTGWPTPDSKEEMAQKILDERGFELVFEYKRKPDLVRFGKYESTCNEYLTARGLAPTVTSKLELFPYPLIDAQQNTFMATENLNRLP